MILSNRKTSCIWCGKRLVNYISPSNVNFGPKQRGEEHIIPKSVFGRIKTHDVCISCNSMFGNVCDHAILKDQRINEAANKVGIKFEDLNKKFEGKRKTESGKEIRVLYENGKNKPLPQLSPKQNLMIPANEWPHLRSDTKKSLIAKVLLKKLPLTLEQIHTEVETLLKAVDVEPNKKHFNETIGEGFQITEAKGPVMVTREVFPWETEWCLAKIVFELSSLVWPEEYQIYFRDLTARFRGFIEKQQHDAATKTGTGIFTFTQLEAVPEKCHEIISIITPTKSEWQLTFFGTARWYCTQIVKPIKAPSGNGYQLTIRNPFGSTSSPDAQIDCVTL